MIRTFAFTAALIISAASIGTTCYAAPIDPIRFELRHASQPGKVELHLRTGERSRGNMHMTFRTADLSGLSSGWTAGGPMRFALARQAGTLDCAGTGAKTHASGTCRHTRDPGFERLMVQSGMPRPTDEQALDLTLTDARRDLLDALRSARYPIPSVEDFIAMSAVGVTPAYVRGLTAAGYRPDNSRRLIEYKALNVSPAYLGELARAGYANLPQHDVIQFAAMKISPDFIRGFDRIGYRNLPASKLVQLKALNVTPEFVQSVRRSGMANPTVEQLVQLRAIGFAPSPRRR
jgi:hypothetical protein